MTRQTTPHAAVILSILGISALLVGPAAVAEPPVSEPKNAKARQVRQALQETSPGNNMIAGLSRPESSPQHEWRELFGADRPGKAEPGDHPLMPALRWAKEHLPAIEGLQDYSATLVKQEEVDGKLGQPQRMFLKIRSKPFSVYSRGLSPAAIKGQEVIYVEGRNQGKLRVHPGGFAGRLVHSLSLDPNGEVAMRDEHFPITQIGIANMIKQLVDVGREDVRHGECEVRFFAGAKIGGRASSWFQVVHPTPRPYFQFNVARVFVDDQMQIPVRFEAYRWPDDRGGTPKLIEEYTYLNLKLNNGFSDEDFSTSNTDYHFR